MQSGFTLLFRGHGDNTVKWLHSNMNEFKRKKEPSLLRGASHIPRASGGVEFPEASLI